MYAATLFDQTAALAAHQRCRLASRTVRLLDEPEPSAQAAHPTGRRAAAAAVTHRSSRSSAPIGNHVDRVWRVLRAEGGPMTVQQIALELRDRLGEQLQTCVWAAIQQLVDAGLARRAGTCDGAACYSAVAPTEPPADPARDAGHTRH